MPSLEYLPQLQALPAEERRDYVRALLISLADEEGEEAVAEAWLVEIRRRLAEDDEATYDYENESVEAVMQRVRASLAPKAMPATSDVADDDGESLAEEWLVEIRRRDKEDDEATYDYENEDGDRVCDRVLASLGL